MLKRRAILIALLCFLTLFSNGQNPRKNNSGSPTLRIQRTDKLDQAIDPNLNIEALWIEWQDSIAQAQIARDCNASTGSSADPLCKSSRRWHQELIARRKVLDAEIGHKYGMVYWDDDGTLRKGHEAVGIVGH